MNRFSACIAFFLLCLAMDAQTYQVVSVIGDGVTINESKEETALGSNQMLTPATIIRNISGGELNVQLREKDTYDCFRIILREKGETYSCSDIREHKEKSVNEGLAFANFMYEQVRESQKSATVLKRSTGVSYRDVRKVDIETCHSIAYSLWSNANGAFLFDRMRSMDSGYPICIDIAGKEMVLSNYSDKELNFVVFCFGKEVYGESTDIYLHPVVANTYFTVGPMSRTSFTAEEEHNPADILVLATEKEMDPELLAENMHTLPAREPVEAPVMKIGFVFGSDQ